MTSIDRLSLTYHVIVLILSSISVHFSTMSLTSADATNNYCTLPATFGCNCSETETSSVTCQGQTINASLVLSQLTVNTLGIVNIHVSGANLSRISSDLLSSSTQLLHLYLGFNGIGDVDVGSFRSLSVLETLDLENNRIRLLKPGTFSGLKNLTVLNLAGNELYVVDVGLFSIQDVPMLFVLDLHDCRINDFEISDLPYLATVNLTSNRLTSFPKFGKGLSNLITVDLSANNIRSLDNAALPYPGPKTLHLSNNFIESLSNMSLFSLLSPSSQDFRLEVLDLTGNRISVIETGSLSAVKMLTELELSFNRLTRVKQIALPWRTLNKVIVHDNPWDCTVDMDSSGTQVTECVNGWLFNESAVKQWNIEANLTCASPSRLAGKNIYVDKVFNDCFPTTSPIGHQGATLYVAITLIICTVAVICVIVYLARRRYRRQHRPIFSTPQTTSPRRRAFGIFSSASGSRDNGDNSAVNDDDSWSSKVSYRQMEDLAPGSFTADQNEL